MNADSFADRIRQFELYSSARIMPDCWTVVRVDGRGFSKLTSAHFDKPFDARFHGLMRDAAKALVEEMQGAFAYTQSDEISLVLPPSWSLFDRRAEKLNSLCAAIATATFSLGFGQPACFDSRLWVGPSRAHVIDYMRWRASDAARCSLGNMCYWTLRGEDTNARAATRELERMSTPDKHELLFERGINFNDLPTWQKRGVIISWETYTKQGTNPVTGESTIAERRRLGVDEEIPMKEEFARYIDALLTRYEEV